LSPTVFRYKDYRFFFFSREETRMHVHVSCQGGEAKFWLQPRVALAEQAGIPKVKLNEISRLVEEHKDEIKAAWQKHLG
jgi:hypothetical protein